jgi:hypothetical protein
LARGDVKAGKRPSVRRAQAAGATKARCGKDAICGWFTEVFDTLDLKEAKALLDELRELI